MIKCVIRISLVMVSALVLAVTGGACAEPKVESAAAKKSETSAERKGLPVLKCKVLYAHGYFAAYSTIPKPGDTTILDLNKITSESTMLKFSPDNKTSGMVYIPFQRMGVKKNDYGYHLTGAELSDHLRRIDVITDNTGKPKEVYITYEWMDLIRGIVVMEVVSLQK